jgi:tripartite-type tricarboxylate transporter receptor subunit TctC
MPSAISCEERRLHAASALLIAASFGAAGSGVSAADESAYPTRPLRWIVPFPPGGSDSVARIVAQRVSEQLGQQIVIDNRAGAAGTLGAALAAKANPDGYTLLFVTSSFAISASYYRKLPYDSVRDFTPIGTIANGPLVIVAHPASGAASLRDLVEIARAKPGTINYASSSAGSITHLATELFNSVTGARLTHVPYKGAGPALTAVLAGEVQLLFSPLGAAIPHVKSGRLRALAVPTPQRSALAPDIPTTAEAGVPGFTAGTWYGMLAPRGAAPQVVVKLNRELAAALAVPSVIDALAKLAFEPNVATPDAFGAYVRAEIAKWAQAIKAAGVTPE